MAMRCFDVSLSIVRLKNRIARCIPYSIHLGPRVELDRRTALIAHDSMREFHSVFAGETMDEIESLMDQCEW